MVGLMERVGIFGGTFDPPHLGHLILAEYAVETLDLSCLLFVPAADPPHKQQEKNTPVEHRLAMLELAISSNSRFTLSRTDVDRPGPHYSVDMVKIIQKQYPDAELFFVMGGDSLRDLPRWYRPAELIQLCRLAVMHRPGDTARPDMHEDVLPGISNRVVMIDAPLIGISATEIILVPDAVLDYICAHQLYGKNPDEMCE
jgi:nicotinate-nucleotide adenylyltransferase